MCFLFVWRFGHLSWITILSEMLKIVLTIFNFPSTLFHLLIDRAIKLGLKPAKRHAQESRLAIAFISNHMVSRYAFAIMWWHGYHHIWKQGGILEEAWWHIKTNDTTLQFESIKSNSTRFGIINSPALLWNWQECNGLRIRKIRQLFSFLW